MRVLLGILLVIILLLQHRLWQGEGGIRSLEQLHRQLASQRAVNSELEERNRQLELEVLDLKFGLEAVEERARSELGMIGEDEVFFLIGK